MAVDILHDHAKPIYGKAHLNSRFRNVAFEQFECSKLKHETMLNEHKISRLNKKTYEWTTILTTFVAVIRAQSKNNCADKQMESQTNHN